MNIDYLEQLINSMEKGVLKLEESSNSNNIGEIDKMKAFILSIFNEINKHLGSA